MLRVKETLEVSIPLETWPKTRIGAGLNAIGEWSHL